MMEDKTTKPAPFEDHNVVPKEEVEIIKHNEWLGELKNGNFVVKTKDGVFEFTDVPYEKVMAARRRATTIKTDGSQVTDTDMFELILMSESMVGKQVPELELKKYKSSSVLRMRAAISKLYDLNAFLSL